MRFDILIIGQGLAGSLLAWRLWHSGATFLVVDRGGTNASRVAAGLVTPVTGKRWVKTSGIDDLLSTAHRLYREIERAQAIQLWHAHPFLRLFRDEHECNLATRRALEPGYKQYLGDLVPSGQAGFGLADEHGSLWLRQAAHLDTRLLLETLRNWLIQHDAYRPVSLKHDRLKLTATGIQWSGIHADIVVFCEGWRVIHNPWFGSLPWQPSQGEIVTLANHESYPPFPVNRGIWLLPESKTVCRIGATYRWHPLEEIPTQEGKSRLLTAFKTLFRHPVPAACIDISAGIRPHTLDHHPIVGHHPRHGQLWLCNGFGSKGSLFAPWCSLHLTDLLLHDVRLPPSITIDRYHEHLTD